MAENNSTNAIRDAFNRGSVRDITHSLVNFAGEAANMAMNSSLSPTGSVMDVMRRISEEGFCNFNKSMGYFMDRLMQINVNEKITTLFSLGQDAHLDGDATSITRNALNPTYARDRNYLDFVDKVRSSETEGRFSTRRMTENGVYAETENLYPDELDRLEGTHKNNVWNAKDDMNSILYKTKRLFEGRKINTLISRFGTGADATKTNLRYNGSARTKFGESHGRNLLKKAAEKGGTDYRYNVNGYSNPYCRVWTHHHQYDDYTKTIRPFENSSLSDIHNWGKQFDSDFTDNWTIARGNGEFDSYKRTYGWKSGDNNGWELSVLDTSKGGDGLLKITPKYLGGLGKNIHAKECMFSIENLAWRDYDPYSFEKALSWEQRGPLGGRIMWFPPYGIQFNETTNVNWSSNTFIGRGEDVYTYVNTQRSGTLSFILLVDHPSVQDYATWHDGSTVSDTDLLRFYAGCDTMDPNDPDSILSSVKPTPLTDEYIEIKPEQDKQEKGNEDADVEKDTQNPETQNPPEGEGKIVFYVFFPNNYSGIYDSSNYSMDGSDDYITSVNCISFPINYLLFGVGAQRFGVGYDSSDNRQSMGDDRPFEYSGKTKSDIGYEGFNPKGLTGENIDYKNSIYVVNLNKTWSTESGKQYYAYDCFNGIDDKKGFRYYHRVDGSYRVFDKGINNEINNTFYQLIPGRDGKKQDTKKPSNDNYKDLKSFKLNVLTDNLPTDWKQSDDNTQVTSLLDVVRHINKNSDTKGLLGKYYKDSDQDIKWNTDIKWEDIIPNITSVSFTGYSNSHGSNYRHGNDRNTALAKNRAEVIKRWLMNDTVLKDKDIKYDNLEFKQGVKVDAQDAHNHDALSAKLYRSTRVEIKYKTAKVEPSSNSDVNNKKTDTETPTLVTPATNQQEGQQVNMKQEENKVENVNSVNGYSYMVTTLPVEEEGKPNEFSNYHTLVWKDNDDNLKFYKEENGKKYVYFPTYSSHEDSRFLLGAISVEYTEDDGGKVIGKVKNEYDINGKISKTTFEGDKGAISINKLLEWRMIENNNQSGNRSTSEIKEGTYEDYAYYYKTDGDGNDILCDKNGSECNYAGNELIIHNGKVYIFNQDDTDVFITTNEITFDFLYNQAFVTKKTGSVNKTVNSSEESVKKAQEKIIEDNPNSCVYSYTNGDYVYYYANLKLHSPQGNMQTFPVLVDGNNNIFFTDDEGNDVLYVHEDTSSTIATLQYVSPTKWGDDVTADVLYTKRIISKKSETEIRTGSSNAYANKSLAINTVFENGYTWTYAAIKGVKVLINIDGVYYHSGGDNNMYVYSPNEDYTGAFEYGCDVLDENITDIVKTSGSDVVLNVLIVEKYVLKGETGHYVSDKQEFLYIIDKGIDGKSQERLFLCDRNFKTIFTSINGTQNKFMLKGTKEELNDNTAIKKVFADKDTIIATETARKEAIDLGLIIEKYVNGEELCYIEFDSSKIKTLDIDGRGNKVEYIERTFSNKRLKCQVKKQTGKYIDGNGVEHKERWTIYNEPDSYSNNIGGFPYAIVIVEVEENGKYERYLYKINDGDCDNLFATNVKFDSSYTGETINDHIRNCKNPNGGDRFIDRDGNVWTYDSNKKDWMLTSIYDEEKGLIRHRKNEDNTLRYDQEYYFFKNLERTNKFVFDKLVEKVKYFDPAFHSMTPEGFNARLTFLQQCTRQGNTRTASDRDSVVASNLAFGRPPYCVLRVGDFYNQMIVIDNMSVDYSVSDGISWDMNPEGVGMQPMLARVNISFKFIGGGDLAGPIRRLQNAMTFNYYANTRLYDNRADTVEYDWDDKLGGANGHYKIKKDSNGQYSVGNYAYTAQYYDDGKGKPLAASTEQAKAQQKKAENSKLDRSKLNLEPMPLDRDLNPEGMFKLENNIGNISLGEPMPNSNEAKQIQKTNPLDLKINNRFNIK